MKNKNTKCQDKCCKMNNKHNVLYQNKSPVPSSMAVLNVTTKQWSLLTEYYRFKNMVNKDKRKYMT